MQSKQTRRGRKEAQVSSIPLKASEIGFVVIRQKRGRVDAEDDQQEPPPYQHHVTVFTTAATR